MTTWTNDTPLRNTLPELLNSLESHLLASPESEHVNVKAYGAVGDGVADDTTAITNAIAAAFTNGSNTVGLITVYFPAGTYLITSTITLNTDDYTSIRFVGAGGTNPGRRATVIKGNINGALIQRTSIASQVLLVFEDLMFWNTHATGEGLKLSGLEPPSGVNRCYFAANKGISLIDNVHSTTISNCKFTNPNGGSPVGSWGIYHGGHGALFNNDIVGFEHGIRVSGPGINISGGRYEINRVGILLGQKEDGTNWVASGVSVTGARGEGNDRFIWAYNVQGGFIGGVSNQGSAAAPAGASVHGIDVGGCYALTIVGAVMGGTYSGFPFNQTTGSFNISFISCYADAAWNLSTSNVGLAVINCTPEVTRIEHPIIATGSLPAAGASQNGRIIIEDNGAGDRNLILYAGGQRFRIDGGAAF